MPQQRLIFDLRQGGALQLNLSHDRNGNTLHAGFVSVILYSNTGGAQAAEITMPSHSAQQIFRAFLGALDDK